MMNENIKIPSLSLIKWKLLDSLLPNNVYNIKYASSNMMYSASQVIRLWNLIRLNLEAIYSHQNW